MGQIRRVSEVPWMTNSVSPLAAVAQHTAALSHDHSHAGLELGPCKKFLLVIAKPSLCFFFSCFLCLRSGLGLGQALRLGASC